MPDISTRKDVELMVNMFYEAIKQDSTLGPIFEEEIGKHWDTHVQTMHSFWGSIILGEQSYVGNPMPKHIQLGIQYKLEKQHFEKWLSLFHATIDKHFSGPKALEAKSRADNIARIMHYKIEQVSS